LQDDTTDGRETFLESVSQDTLGWNLDSVQATFFDIIVDPSCFVVKKSDNDLTTRLNLFLKSFCKVIGSVTLNFNTDWFLESDSEGLSTLLEHTHQFLSIVKAVVHENPVVKTGGLTDFILNISQIISIL